MTSAALKLGRRVRLLDEGEVYALEDHEGVLVNRIRGVGDREDVNRCVDAFQKQLIPRAPARVLIDTSDAVDISMSGRWDLASRMKENRPYIARTAVIGLRPSLELALRVLLRVSGRDNIKTFGNYEDAMAWLEEA